MKRLTLVAILGFAILLLFGCGERQASITGVVTDSESGDPLRDAIVTLEEHTAKTGADGHYHLDKVLPGSYTLTARMEGYKPYDRQIDAQGKQEVILDITLSPLEEPTPLPIAEEGQDPYRVIERTSSAISPREGGSIVITEAESIYLNGFMLSVPPGALEEETVITVGDVTDDFPPIPDGLRPVGLPISLEPHGLTFQRAVTVKVPYSNEMLAYAGVISPEDLMLKTYDLSMNEWTDIPIVQVDTQNGVIVAEIDHFSLFSLFSWWNRKETKNPATNKQILTYINDSWGVVAAVDDLARWNANTGIPFKDEIGGILTVMAMTEQVQNEKYRKAAITGGEWLAWQALKTAGYGWLRPFALLVEATYKGGVWFVKELDEGAFNAQICAYLYYRREGYSVEEIKDLFVTDDGWVLTAMGTGCPPGYPRLTGRFKPEDVFRIGSLVWDAKQSGNYRQRDTESIRVAFIDAIWPVTPNQPPQVRITSPSEEATFTAGEAVNLAGTAADPEDGPLTGSSLTWRIETAGSSTFLGQGETLSLSNLAVGSHKISLAAKDSQGETVEDSIEITVQAAANMPPEVTIATPSDGTIFAEGDSILFTGSAIDPEDGPLADRSLVWVSGIDGVLGPGQTVTRDDLSPGTHAITLSATDSHSVFSTKTVTITIEPSTPNEPPIADAGADQTVYVEDTVTLDGTASYDPENNPLTFRWTQSSGAPASLNNALSVTPSFTPLTAGEYNFCLVVNDGKRHSAPDYITVTVVEETPAKQHSTLGEYINPDNPDDCLEINPDGTCYMEILGLNIGTTGSWKIDNGRISLFFPDGTTIRGELKDEAIVCDEIGMLPPVWVKPTRTPPTYDDVVGAYIKRNHPDEYLFLKPDGTYTATERGFGDQLWTSSGEWEIDGHTVTLFYLGDRTSGLTGAVLENHIYFGGLVGVDVWTKSSVGGSASTGSIFGLYLCQDDPYSWLYLSETGACLLDDRRGFGYGNLRQDYNIKGDVVTISHSYVPIVLHKQGTSLIDTHKEIWLKAIEVDELPRRTGSEAMLYLDQRFPAVCYLDFKSTGEFYWKLPGSNRCFRITGLWERNADEIELSLIEGQPSMILHISADESRITMNNRVWRRQAPAKLDEGQVLLSASETAEAYLTAFFQGLFEEAERYAASKFLEEFRESIEAWRELLELPLEEVPEEAVEARRLADSFDRIEALVEKPITMEAGGYQEYETLLVFYTVYLKDGSSTVPLEYVRRRDTNSLPYLYLVREGGVWKIF